MAIFRRNTDEIFDCRKTMEYFENNREIRKENFLTCPDWLDPEYYDEMDDDEAGPDELEKLIDPFRQRRFYKEGQVALGALVQANMLLFKRGRDSCPANYIYTKDPYFLDHPQELAELASALFQIKGDTGYQPSLQRLADLLADEMERIFAYRLPRDVTEGKAVYFTTVLVERSHLPKKKLTGSLLPLLILMEEQPDAMILPWWYWKA